MHGVLLNTSTDGSQWIAIIVAILTVIYIAFVRPMRKNKKDPLERKPGDALLAQQRAAERDMTALLLEYEQMMRTMTSQIETRIAKLEVLLKDADERLQQLKAATSDLPASVAQPAVAKGGGLDLTPLLAESEPPGHQDVYALADQGLSHRQIAQRLDRPYGEIELILTLRSKSIDPVGRDAQQGENELPDTDRPDDPQALESPDDSDATLDAAPEPTQTLVASGGGVATMHQHRRHRKKRR